jgi:hypothetical protein
MSDEEDESKNFLLFTPPQNSHRALGRSESPQHDELDEIWIKQSRAAVTRL